MPLSAPAPLPAGFRRRRGFTLLELMVVIFLLSLTMGIAAVGLSGATETAQLKSEARQLTALLRHLRHQAITEGTITGVESVAADEADTVAGVFQTLPDKVVYSPPSAIKIELIDPEVPVEIPLPGQGVYFFPDGSASGGGIRLVSAAGEREVHTFWLTGETRLVEAGDDEKSD